MQYYITINGRTVGPMSAQQLMYYDIDSNTPVSRDGSDWAPMFTYPELMELYNRHRGRVSGGTDGVSQRLLCGLLAIFLGSLGIQYFVVGKTTAGILTILLSLVTCGGWSIITLIQGILMLCMSDAEFNRKYVQTTSTFPIF